MDRKNMKPIGCSMIGIICVIGMLGCSCVVSAGWAEESGDSNGQAKTAVFDDEMNYLKSRTNIFRLADQVTATGNVEAYEKLKKIYQSSAPDDIKGVALSEMRRVRNYFEVMVSQGKVEVSYDDHGVSKNFLEKKIPTDMLLDGLKHAPSWGYRARIAELLKDRKEKGVPDVLLESALTDQHMQVREKARVSFESITGFSDVDDVTGQKMFQWWSENSVQINETLKDLQTLKMVLEKK